MKDFMLRILVIIGLMLAVPTWAKTNTLVHCPVSLPQIFNPGLSFDANTGIGSSHLYNSLLDLDPSDKQLIPELAKSWKTSSNGLRVEFELYSDIWFHSTDYFTPSRPLNSDDVIFTYDRMMNKQNPFHKVNNANYPFFSTSELGNLLLRVEKVSDLKFAFILKEAYSPIFYNLTSLGFPVLSKEYADQLAKAGRHAEIDTKPIGTGPFKFKSFARDRYVKYTRNDKYFRGKPKMDQLILTPVPEASVRLQKLRTGECHLIDQPHSNDIAKINAHSDLSTLSATKGNIGFLVMNTKKKPFDDVRVRKAISMALDREKYVKLIYNGYASAAAHPLSSIPAFETHRETKRDLAYTRPRLKEAKKLLAQAGLKDGLKVELWTLPVNRPYIPDGKKLGELVQSDLAKVGIDVNLVSYEWPTYLKKLNEGEHTIAMIGWMNSNGNPDQYLSANLTCNNIETFNNARWCEPGFDKLIIQARREMNAEKRTALYKKSLELVNKGQPWAPIAHGHYYLGKRKDLKGVMYSSYGNLNLESASW